MIRPISADEVTDFISDFDVFDEISEDGTPYPLTIPELPGFTYQGLFVNGSLVGMTCLHDRGRSKEIHISVKKPFQHKARELVEHSLKGQENVFASIPEYKKTVLNLARKFGFERVGEDGVFLKNGINHRKILWHLSRQH